MPRRKNTDVYTKAELEWQGRIFKYFRQKVVKVDVREMSKTTGIPEATIYTIENSKHLTNLVTLKKMANAYGYQVNISFKKVKPRKWIGAEKVIKNED